MNIIYRKATLNDEYFIISLLKEVFGSVYRDDDVHNRLINEIIYVAEYNNIIIGTTGISLDRTEFNGHEISWTGVKSKFRGQDIMINLVQNCLNELNDNLPLYLSAWHLNGKDRPNLHKTIDHFGLVLVKSSYKQYNKIYCNFCNSCPYKDNCAGCSEDLFILER